MPIYRPPHPPRRLPGPAGRVFAVLSVALATAAPAWPAYHLGQLGLKVVGHDAGGPVWLHLLVLAVVAIAFFVLAQRRLSRAE